MTIVVEKSAIGRLHLSKGDGVYVSVTLTVHRLDGRLEGKGFIQTDNSIEVLAFSEGQERMLQVDNISLHVIATKRDGFGRIDFRSVGPILGM